MKKLLNYQIGNANYIVNRNFGTEKAVKDIILDQITKHSCTKDIDKITENVVKSNCVG